MIHTISTHTACPSNSLFDQKNKNFDMVFMGNQAIEKKEMMWSGDLAYGSGDSPWMRAAMAPGSFMIKNKNRLEKLERIKRLIVSGRYKIDAEKLAEKMLGSMGGLLMAN